MHFVDVYKDLGVKISVIVCRVGSMMNNILRSIICRSGDFIVTLWVSHICPLIEYASYVWNVWYLMDNLRLISLQGRCTRGEVVGMNGLDYISRLKNIGLFSLKSRFLRLDLVKVCKCFHAEIDIGLVNVLELTTDMAT